jgi:predicted TIM-barrel fold metal-dependent hydrolase
MMSMLGTDPAEYASAMLRAAGTELMLVDDGYPPADVGMSWQELGELGDCPSRPVLRIERVAEEAAGDALDGSGRRCPGRAHGYAALKTIAAYRGGLDLNALSPSMRSDRLEGVGMREALLAALEANEASGDPLPVQVHTGFGDSDLSMPRASPGYLKPLIERFQATSFVLLHCYPFVREAGWLAYVYANVYFDLSLTIPDPTPPQVALDQPARKVARRGQTPHQGDRPLPRRDQRPHVRLGRA